MENDPLDALERRLHYKERKARNQRDMHRRVRNAVIDHLGGKCAYCDETDKSKLEVHHVKPVLGYRDKHINAIHEWRMILAGKIDAKLACRDHHIQHEHNGNTCILKKVKHNHQL